MRADESRWITLAPLSPLGACSPAAAVALTLACALFSSALSAAYLTKT